MTGLTPVGLKANTWLFRVGVIVRECGQTLGLGLVDRNRTVVFY